MPEHDDWRTAEITRLRAQVADLERALTHAREQVRQADVRAERAESSARTAWRTAWPVGSGGAR